MTRPDKSLPTTVPDPAPDQGWGFPGMARKCHYFQADGYALCGHWHSLGMPPGMFTQDTGKPSPDDCVACRRKLDARGTA